MSQPIEIVFDRQIETYAYYAETHLVREEARNNLILGLISNLRSGLTASASPPVLIRMMSGQEVLSVALQTPPNPFVITRATEEQLAALLAALVAKRLELPSVVGPPEEAQYFAKQWCELKSITPQLAMDQGIYQLEKVILPTKVPGNMRIARPDETDLLAQWLDEFQAEATPNNLKPKAETRKKTQQIIAANSLYVWEQDGRPVSMTGSWGSTPNGVRINAVYTPPPLRRRGIAARLVAEVSQAKLESGKKLCFLYTDLSNPTSNRIYQKIGYQLVCGSRHYVFVRENT